MPARQSSRPLLVQTHGPGLRATPAPTFGRNLQNQVPRSLKCLNAFPRNQQPCHRERISRRCRPECPLHRRRQPNPQSRHLERSEGSAFSLREPRFFVWPQSFFSWLLYAANPAAKAPPRPRITGIAGVRIHVSSANTARGFYGKYLRHMFRAVGANAHFPCRAEQFLRANSALHYQDYFSLQ